MVCNKVPSQQQADLNGKLWILKNRGNRRVKIRQTKIPLYLVPEEAVACWLAGKLSHGLVSLALRCWSRSLEAVFKGIMFWLQSFQAHLLDVNRITWTLLNWLIVANKLTIPVFLNEPSNGTTDSEGLSLWDHHFPEQNLYHILLHCVGNIEIINMWRKLEFKYLHYMI